MKSSLSKIIITFLILTTSCMSMKFGKSIDPAKFSQIQEDKTTESKLVEMLGQPTMSNDGMVLGGWRPSCGKKGDSIRMLTYQSATSMGSMGGANTTTDSSIFYINPKGVVCKKSKQGMNMKTPGLFGS